MYDEQMELMRDLKTSQALLPSFILAVKTSPAHLFSCNFVRWEGSVWNVINHIEKNII